MYHENTGAAVRERILHIIMRRSGILCIHYTTRIAQSLLLGGAHIPHGTKCSAAAVGLLLFGRERRARSAVNQ